MEEICCLESISLCIIVTLSDICASLNDTSGRRRSVPPTHAEEFFPVEALAMVMHVTSMPHMKWHNAAMKLHQQHKLAQRTEAWSAPKWRLYMQQAMMEQWYM